MFQERRYRWLLRLLPASFRQEHESEILRVWREEADEAALEGRRGVWVDALSDTLRTAPREHASVWSRNLRLVLGSLRTPAPILPIRATVRRLFRQDAGFALFACATMALGLWMVALLFAIANGLLLRPLPYPESEDLARVVANNTSKGQFNVGLSWSAYERLRILPAVEASAAFQATGLNISLADQPMRVAGAFVTPSLFNAIGVAPLVGRVFSEDEWRNRHSVVVISEIVVRGAGLQPEDSLGRQFVVNGESRVIVGVMPAHFRFPEIAQAWVPLTPPVLGRDTTNGPLTVVVRVSGENAATLREQLQTIPTEPTAPSERWTLIPTSLNPLRSEGVGPLLFAGVLCAMFLLLTVTANVAALMLARGVARQGELAIMSALGASRRQLVLHILTESFILTSIATGVALLLTAWSLQAVPTVLSTTDIPDWVQITLDRRVLLFTLLAAAVGALVMGVLPARASLRSDSLSVTRSNTRTVAGGPAYRLQRVLVGGQLFLATVLLVGGGLLIRSSVALRSADLGYDPSGVYMLETELAGSRWRSADSVPRFYAGVLARLQADRRVRAAAVAGGTTLARGGTQGTGVFQELRVAETGHTGRVEHIVVSSDFFQTLGIAFASGRAFHEDERAGSIVVNESFAGRYLNSESPVGMSVIVQTPIGDTPARVVGVVHNVLEPFVGEGASATAQPKVYLPISTGISRSATLYARVSGSTGSVSSVLREAVQAEDPNQPVWSVTSLEDYLEQARSPVKWFAYVFGFCAVLALVVSAVGLYGVISYGVRRRRREFAIRLACGASPNRVRRLILRDGLMPTVAGLLLGLVAAAGLGRGLSLLLYGVPIFDFAVTLITASSLLITGYAASVLPAVTMAKTNPAALLRAD